MIQSKKHLEEVEEALCFHCGDACDETHHQSGGKSFCCFGCQTVYELLSKNDLCNYYDLQSRPGNKLRDFLVDKYSFLENEEIADKLLTFKSSVLYKVTLDIPAIHCSSCIWLLENLKRFNQGIVQSRINFGRKLLTIDYAPQSTSLLSIVNLLCQLGYEPEINLNQNGSQQEPKTDKSQYIKLGVSGFIFGNTMLFSFPEYLGIQVDSEFRDYFSFLNLLLSLPMLFYCAQEFFISAFRGLTKRIMNIDLPISLGILAIFLNSVYELASSTGSGYFDSMSGLVFFLLIGRWFQHNTYRKLSYDRTYKSYFPLAVYQIKEKVKESVLIENLRPGDRIEIRNHEIIPCDSILIDDVVYVDYSFVSGESEAVKVEAGEKIYAGGKVKGTAVRMDVIQTVSHSYLSQLWNHEVFSKNKASERNLLINKVSSYFTPIVILIALLSSAVWLFIEADRALMIFASVMIIACPCALALVEPFTLGSVINTLARSDFYLKHTDVIERIWKIKLIVFDKTGTITTHQTSNISFHGHTLNDRDKSMVSSLTYHSTHILSRVIHDFVDHSKSSKPRLTSFTEMKGRGVSGKFDQNQVKLGSATYLGLKEENTIKSASRVYLAINSEIKGYFEIKLNYRNGLQNVINNLKPNYLFSILSGDNDGEKKRLELIFPKTSSMNFNQTPEDKLSMINHLQQQNSCMMIGDGLNDAGALQSADVGISVTDDLSSFVPASDAILKGAKLSKLDQFIKLIQQSKKVMLVGLIISFLYNVLGLSFAITGMVTPVFAAILMPISSISVTVFSTLTIRLLGRRIV